MYTEEIDKIKQELNISESCAADVFYLRTRNRHTQQLENELIDLHHAGTPPNMMEFGVTKETQEALMSAVSKALETQPHVDDWLDTPTYPWKDDDNINYAKFVLEFARMPAFKQQAYKQWIQQFELYCTYQNKRYRVTGASRLGDVWLQADFTRDHGYNLRVSLKDCNKWSPNP